MDIQWVLSGHLAITVWFVQEILVSEQVCNWTTYMKKYLRSLYCFMDVFSESLTDISKFELQLMMCSSAQNDL